MNEHSVGLGESTCNGVSFAPSNRTKPALAGLNIIDLGKIALERANTSRSAVTTMGELAMKYGYIDAAESLMVIDPNEAYIFHITKDDTGAAAIWIAERVPDDSVGAVMNAFTIRHVNFTDHERFLWSANIRRVAARNNLWEEGTPFDFTRVFAGGTGPQYASGRRMWAVYRAFGVSFPSTYADYVLQSPYPATVRVAAGSIGLANVISVMRDYYEGTEYSLTEGLAAGPFGSPSRWQPSTEDSTMVGGWERSIATHRSSVSFVLEARRWLPSRVGGTVWFAPHASHTASYVPFPCGLETLPKTHTNATAFETFRSVFNRAQMNFALQILDIRAAQERSEREGRDVQAVVDRGEDATGALIRKHAEGVVATWRELGSTLYDKYADGYCSGCGHGPRRIGYPLWWLKAVGYESGPHSTSGSSRSEVKDAHSAASALTPNALKGCIQNCRTVYKGPTLDDPRGVDSSAAEFSPRCVERCLDRSR